MPAKEFLKKWRSPAGMAITLALVLASAALAGWLLWSGSSVPVYIVTRSDIVQNIVASGRVETPRRVELGSSVIGTVVTIPVAEGQSVKAGQLLIGLDDTEARAAVEQARAAVAQAEARMRQVHELNLPTARLSLRQAEVNLQNVKVQYDRVRELSAKGFVGQSQLDDARRNLDIAESQSQTARLQIASNSPHGSDFMMTQAALAQARANLGMAQAKLHYLRIQAPVAGTLITRSVEQGDVVQPGKVLMGLSPDGPTQIVAQIDEKNLAALRLGQKAFASADAYPAQRFPVELAYINPAVDAQRGSVEVKLNVAKPPEYLRQDMTVSVDIEVARHQNALTVPVSAIQVNAAGGSSVLRQNGRNISKQEISTGIRTISNVEVLSGIQPGDTLIYTSPILPEGERPRTNGSGGQKFLP